MNVLLSLPQASFTSSVKVRSPLQLLADKQIVPCHLLDELICSEHGFGPNHLLRAPPVRIIPSSDGHSLVFVPKGQPERWEVSGSPVGVCAVRDWQRTWDLGSSCQGRKITSALGNLLIQD